MPDISYQMQLLQRMQDPNSESSPMGALRALGGAVGNAWQGYEGRNDEQDAVRYFMEKPVSPESIQEFSASHPRMPLTDVYKYAGTIATQKKAQAMKDKVKVLQRAVADGRLVDEKLIPSLFPDSSPDELEELNKILTGAQQVGLNFKNLNKSEDYTLLQGTKRFRKAIGGQDIEVAVNPAQEDPSVWIVSPDGKTRSFVTPKEAAKKVAAEGFTKYEKPANETALEQAVAAKLKETNPATGKPYTAAEAYREVAHTDNGVSYHVEKRSIGNTLTQDYRVFVDKQGNVTKEEKVGVPYKNTEGVAQVRVEPFMAPQQTPLIDPITQRPLIWDKKNQVYRVADVEGGGGIAPRPVNPSSTEREKTASIEALKKQAESISEVYQKNPNFVGVASGQAGRVSQLWNKDEAYFRQKILSIKDALLRAKSGAQINEQEYARLSKLVPDMGDSDAMFEGKMKAFQEELSILSTQRETAQQQGGVVKSEAPKATGKKPLSAY